MDSNRVRDSGFLEVLKEYPAEQVDQLLVFHHQNGGLSRYVKFRHFFEVVRGESVSEHRILELASHFSAIMKVSLQNPALLIPETLAFVRENSSRLPMHIVSGSDEMELRFLCEKLGIAGFFRSIHGSPTAKDELVGNLLQEYGYNPQHCFLVGDSINDYEAARSNEVSFIEFNNPLLRTYAAFPFSSWKVKALIPRG